MRAASSRNEGGVREGSPDRRGRVREGEPGGFANKKTSVTPRMDNFGEPTRKSEGRVMIRARRHLS